MHSLKSYSFQVCELLDTGTFLAVNVLRTAEFSGQLTKKETIPGQEAIQDNGKKSGMSRTVSGQLATMHIQASFQGCPICDVMKQPWKKA